MFLTLASALGLCLLGFHLLGFHCVFFDGHMGDIPVPSYFVLCHKTTQLHLFTAQRRER